MKAILVTCVLGVLFVLVPLGSAQAVCGIGSQIWEGRNGLGAKLLASTTNFWTMKAISTTFGVAGCNRGDPLFGDSRDAEILHFASNNFDRLSRDMARGSGEYLDVLTNLIQVREENRWVFEDLTKQNFETLYSRDDITVGEMLVTLERLMAEDEVLSDYVQS
jgi:hypothetical protein